MPPVATISSVIGWVLIAIQACQASLRRELEPHRSFTQSRCLILCEESHFIDAVTDTLSVIAAAF